jgi:hypothetical protein
LTLSWLVAYERHSGHLTDKSDVTYFSRESLRDRGEFSHDVEDGLVDAVRDVALDAMVRDSVTTTRVLLASKMLLGRKVAMFCLSRAVALVETTDPSLSEMLIVADRLLSDEESIADACRIEYAELARAVARATGRPVAVLDEVIDAGPRVDAERLCAWVRGDASDESSVDSQVREYVDRWKHRWLAALGIDAISARMQTELAQLDSRYGAIADPLGLVRRITSWSGPNSPFSLDQMAAMTPAQLIAELESWRTDGLGWGLEPSYEGLGRELTRLLTTTPLAFSGIDDVVARLRPTYLRAALQGWEAALQGGLELDWLHVAGVVGGVLVHSDGSEFRPSGGAWDDDVDFRAAKQAAVSLLDDLVQKRTSRSAPVEVMALFADLLIDVAADDRAWSDYANYDGSGDMDALTMSLNWQWPVRLRGLIHLMSHGMKTPWYERARSVLEAELERDDVRGASRAVLGEGLGHIVDVDFEWIAPKVARLFGDASGLSPAQQISLTTAMSVHRYHPVLYDLLTAPMLGALAASEPLIVGWNTHADPLQRVGEWIINAIVLGHTSIDVPLAQAFFAVVPAKVRGEAIGRIAWSFMHAEVVDDEVRDRLADLWDLRVAHVRAHPDDAEELSEFYWFVRSKRFPPHWWLPRLVDVATLSPSLSAGRHMIGQDLATSAKIDPRAAFEALKILNESHDDTCEMAWDLSRHAVPQVLAAAMSSGDQRLQRDADIYMNELGERGNLSLQAAVLEILAGGSSGGLDHAD